MILDLLEDNKTPDSATLVFEFKDLISLSILISNIKPKLYQLLITNILNSISYIHSQNLIHCNLSTENIFVSKNYMIKIGGFEFAKTQEELSQGSENLDI